MSQLPNSPELDHWLAELEIAALQTPVPSAGANLPQADSLALTSVWQLESPSAADSAMTGQGESFVYRRVAHPNARSLANKLATLHGATRAVVTAQGMSAIAAIALTGLQPGARVWMGEELYGETSQLLGQRLARWQIEVHTFDPCDAEQVAQLATSRVDYVFIETLTNPRLRMPDLTRLAEATHQAGGKLVVDNTFATHLLCRPLPLGADLVVESLGKQVNGHSDGMVGMIAGHDPQLMDELARTIKTFGWTSSPLDCYLTQRGLLTMAVRLERACANALALAMCLSTCKAIQQVDYPGLTDSPSRCLAEQQFRGGFGWMICFQVAPDRALVERLFAALRPEIRFVPSLGDVNTTLSHPVSTSHRNTAPQTLERLGIDEGTIRVSCGIEPTQWLVERFSSALASCEK